MTEQRKPRWERLDNAALIFPASHRKTWSNLFRVSFSMKDPIDPDILQLAADHLKPRFPTVFIGLKKSAFWYYAQETPRAPLVRPDGPTPVAHMSREEFSNCAVRILYFENRLAVECFHAVTDGTGGMIFAKNLAAEYVRLFYKVDVPCEFDIKDLSAAPPPEELRDDFKNVVGPVSAPRDPINVYRIKGELEEGRYLHDTLGIIDTERLLTEAKRYGVTATAYLAAVMLLCLQELQAKEVPKRMKRKAVKVQIPVNLRKLYPSSSMRNFVSLVNVGVDPRLGDYTLEELIEIVSCQMRLTITEKNMKTIFRPNLTAEQNPLIKIVPRPVKDLIMRAVFDRVGENVSCLSFSNLGAVKLPDVMHDYVTRAEFIVSAQATAPYNCGVASYGGKTYIHLVRDTVEPRLERKFFTELVKLGYHVKIESNDLNEE